MNSYLPALIISIVSAPEFVVFLFNETIVLSPREALIMIMLITLGGTFGSTAIYLGARFVGHGRCQTLLEKYGGRLLLKPSDMADIIYYYHRWGGFIVFFGRWLPTFRSLVSIPAGLSGMPRWRFIVLTFSGTLVWNIILCSALYAFRAYLEYLEVGLEGYTWLTIIAVFLLLAYFMAKRISERIRNGAKNQEYGTGKNK
jgi:membrane protein DedA with SNARE-associated domain